jgi:hypothetical protein
MAEVITVQPNDTISRILSTKRGLQPHQIHDWLARLRPMNPHIGNLDRIYPGERALIPDSLKENVASAQIWQNVFSSDLAKCIQPYPACLGAISRRS